MTQRFLGRTKEKPKPLDGQKENENIKQCI